MPTIATQKILRAIVDERRRQLSRSLQERHAPSLQKQLRQLKSQTEALRVQAMKLNAQLAARASEAPFAAMREQLVEGTARLDRAVSALIKLRD